VSRGTNPGQRTIAGTLTDLVDRCRAVAPNLRDLAPAVTIVGGVVELREQLRWFDAGPLSGRRIVITRPREQSAELIEALRRRGAEPILCPAIRIEPLPNPDLSPLDAAWDWVVFTSANAVRCLTAALLASGADLRRLGSARLAAVGTATARELELLSLHVDFVPGEQAAEGLIAEFPEAVAGRRILIPRAREARPLLVDAWRAAGGEVKILPLYETLPDVASLAAGLDSEAGAVDALTFMSASAVRYWKRHAPVLHPPGARIVCIGHAAGEAAVVAGLVPDAVAGDHSTGGLVAALEALFRQTGRVLA
jgi:uroporphyrinogen III methyltransferase/synthase